MKSTRLALLLAAATITALPAAAFAQEHGAARQGEPGLERPSGAGRGEGRRDDRGGDRQNGGGRNDGGRQRGPGPEARPAQSGGQMIAPAPSQPAPQFDANRQARAMEYSRRQAQQGRGFDGNWSRGQGNGRRDFDRPGPGPGLQAQPGRPQRVDDNRGFAGRDDRGGDHHRYVEVGRDNRGFDNRGAWQRSWRNDNRYDWQGWRTRNRGLFHSPRYVPPRGYGFGYRLFSPGFRLDPFFYDQGYWLADPWDYRLPPAYGPYRWVRYYNDVLLVDITRGVVVDVIRDFFW